MTTRGVRATAAGVAVTVLLVGVIAVVLIGRGESSGDISLRSPALPEVVNAPGTWLDAERIDGPVAALGLSLRTRPEGITGERESLELFGVSAANGRSAWLDLPGFDLEESSLVGQFAVSPDGRWIGWSRYESSRGPRGGSRFVGWAVMETTTGEVRRLDPVERRVRDVLADLAFSGDSRYLLTSYQPYDAPARQGHQLVAWDVEDGTSTVIEKPGARLLPNLGSAPTDVVWSRGHTVHRYDVPLAQDSTQVLPHLVVAASWAPDDRAFAYLGAPKGYRGPIVLYAGSTLVRAREHVIAMPGGLRPGQLVGWVDERHVVIGVYRTTVYIVDIVTGDVVERAMRGSGEQVNSPLLAADLWRQPPIAAPTPGGTGDPRLPWWCISGALLLSLAAFAVLRYRRRDRRVPPTWSGYVVPGPAPQLPRQVPGLRPLSSAATGLLLVLIDVRLEGFDVIPDPIGWVVAALALTSLERLHRGFSVAGLAAWCGLLVSLPDWVGVEHPLISIATALALLVVEVATCTALISTSPERASSAAAIRRLTVVLSGVLALAILAADAEPGVGVLALTVAVLGFGVAVWFLVTLYGAAKQLPGSPEPTPTPAHEPPSLIG